MQCNCSKCRIVVENKLPTPIPTKSRNQWLQTKSTQIHRKSGLGCLDILDELTYRDVVPFHSAYPRRDNVHPVKEDSNKHVKDMYLYKLMYGDQQNYFHELVDHSPPRKWNRTSYLESQSLPMSPTHMASIGINYVGDGLKLLFIFLQYNKPPIPSKLRIL